MDDIIINNLYEFWSLAGSLTHTLIETQNFKAVSQLHSDWPSRVFSITDKEEVYDEVRMLVIKGDLPRLLTVGENKNLRNLTGLTLHLTQRNMAVNLNRVDDKEFNHNEMIAVSTKHDAEVFARTASASFGYRVDWEVVYAIAKDTERVRVYNFRHENECAGCGILFFDSQGYSGLHMIGTLPQMRGKGIGRKITEQMLFEAKVQGKSTCVLNASVMGEPVYAKLGFERYGELKTYCVEKFQRK